MAEENMQDDFWYCQIQQDQCRGVSLDAPGGENGTEDSVGATGGRSLEKDGLPWQAFAVFGDRADPGTWFLPHHTKAVKKAVKGKIGYEHTVDWKAMPRMVYLLSRFGRMEAKLPLDPEQVLQAATHLAVHYIEANKPVPDAIAAISYMGK
jgi:hypothetical protein